jgi:hypothetical protein
MGAACRAIPAITSHQIRGHLLRNARSSGIVPRGRPDFGPYFSWSESRDGPRFLHVAVNYVLASLQIGGMLGSLWNTFAGSYIDFSSRTRR